MYIPNTHRPANQTSANSAFARRPLIALHPETTVKTPAIHKPKKSDSLSVRSSITDLSWRQLTQAEIHTLAVPAHNNPRAASAAGFGRDWVSMGCISTANPANSNPADKTNMISFNNKNWDMDGWFDRNLLADHAKLN